MAAAKTKTPPVDGTTEAVEAVEVLDAFETRLVTAVAVEGISTLRAKLSKVILGEVLGGMFDALDAELPPVKDTAPKSEKNGRLDIIRQRMMSYIAEKTGRYYSWSNIDRWRTAGAVNVTLPERVRVTMTEAESGDPKDAVLDGAFSVWALSYLGQIEDESKRASVAEELFDAGRTSETDAKEAADKANGKTPTPNEPKAAHLLIDALVKSLRKSEAATIAKLEHILLTVPADDALALIDAGRVFWSKTRSDSGETDRDKRNRKRREVFTGAVVQIVDAVGVEDEDDGAEQPGDTPVL